MLILARAMRYYTGYGPMSVCADRNRSSIKMAKRIQLVLGMRSSFDLSYTML